MSRVISWIRSIRLHRITLVVAGIVFLLSAACSNADLQATSNPETLTPEASSYQVDENAAADQLRSDAETLKTKAQATGKSLVQDTQQATKKAQESTQATGNDFLESTKKEVQNAANNVRGKLSLDQAAEGTQQAWGTLLDRAGQTVKGTERSLEDAAKPVTGKSS